MNGNKDIARLLIKNGEANVNAVDADGKTALMIAVINGHQNLVELLLKHDADITVKNAVSAFNCAMSLDLCATSNLYQLCSVL